MSIPADENNIDGVLAEAFGPRPEADFDGWRRQHSKVVETLASHDVITIRKRRAQMRRIARIAAAAVLVIGVGIGISYLAADRNGGVALAEVYETLQQAKTVTWTHVYYLRFTSKDKKTTWSKATTRQCMYKAPGRTRTVELADDGQIQHIEIEDRIRGMRLTLAPAKKKAWLTYLGEPSKQARSTITDLFTMMSRQITADAESLGTRQIGGRQTRGFRVTRDDMPHWSTDFWVDAKSKRLVRVHKPGIDKYDPDNDPTRNNPPGEKYYHIKALGAVERDIVYDQPLDDSLFSLEPPVGYTIETIRIPEPTEKDMIEWLRIWAECNDGTFPESEMPILKRVIDKSNQREKLSAAEKQILDRSLRHDAHHPIRRFAEMTAGDTWHYQGESVELGDGDAIVCWYKPKDSKNYRVVYGDLSVKIVAPRDLPLQEKPEKSPGAAGSQAKEP